jgi:hypothetical protein
MPGKGFGKKILQACKPDSVLLGPGRTPGFQSAIIYLGWLLPATSICLPWIIGRAALWRSYTWHFSTQGLPAAPVARSNRGLLPHIFTLTYCASTKGGYFLWHCLVPFKRKPAVSRCVALCCPDFPTRFVSESIA